MRNVKIIAEAGVNHNGSIKKAHELIDRATECKADAIKFQTFIADDLISNKAPLANHHKANVDNNISHKNLIKKLELPFDAFIELKKHCDQNKIEFISTPYDTKSANFLLSLDIDTIKIASSELTNYPLIEILAKSNKELILSTGMSTFEEIEDSIRFILKLNHKLTVLKCTSNYPADYNEINLMGLNKIKKKFPNIKIGFSDHCPGSEASILAIAFQISVIEKHFTLNKQDWGPDHKASLDFHEFSKFVNEIRNAEKSLGLNDWNISNAELEQKKVMQKGTFAAKPILKGEVLSLENVCFMRPMGSISPKSFYLNYLNRKVNQNIEMGEEIKKEYFYE